MMTSIWRDLYVCDDIVHLVILLEVDNVTKIWCLIEHVFLVRWIFSEIKDSYTIYMWCLVDVKRAVY